MPTNPATHDTLAIPAGRSARVDTIALYPGVSPGTIAAAVAQNAAGIVLSATGSGNTHPDITAQVSLAVQQGVTVVVSTRVPYGEVAARYGGGGGAVDLVAAGALVSAWLRAPQARMALIALLTAGVVAVLADSAASATTDRLSVVDEQLTDIDWDGLVQAYRATTVLRWTLRSRRWEKTPRSAWDIVTLGELAPHDRAALRSAGREVLRAQRVVRYQWRLL